MANQILRVCIHREIFTTLHLRVKAGETISVRSYGPVRPPMSGIIFQDTAHEVCQVICRVQYKVGHTLRSVHYILYKGNHFVRVRYGAGFHWCIEFSTKLIINWKKLKPIQGG